MNLINDRYTVRPFYSSTSGPLSPGPLRPEASERPDGELFQRPATGGGYRQGPQRHLADHPLSDQRHGGWVPHPG